MIELLGRFVRPIGLDDVPVTSADVECSEFAAGFRPTTAIDEGLSRFVLGSVGMKRLPARRRL